MLSHQHPAVFTNP